MPAEIRWLIRGMSLANVLWGAPRIHGELLKLRIDVAESTVAKRMMKGGRPPSLAWKTFLRNHAGGIAAMDFLIVPTIAFRLLHALVILGHDRRQIASVSVTAHPTAEWIARQILDAFAWNKVPCYLVRDRDSAYRTVMT
ncbi:MAG TPA: transposase [Alphaproteobacteria bacterium]